MKNFLKSIFLSVFIITIGFSLLRTLLNISKIYTEEKSWIFLSEERKKQKLYGDLYYFYRDIKNMTPKTIYLLSKDGKAYYLGRYLLYPQRIYWTDNETIYHDKVNKTENSIAAIYHQQDFLKSSKKLNGYSTVRNNNMVIGVYKIQ